VTDSSLRGQIEKVNYLSDESGFAIVSLRVPGQPEAVTVTGQLNCPAVGESVELTGEFKRHPRYGLQFEARSCVNTPPDTERALKKYLGSGLIKGVGQAIAKKMVDTFGKEVLEVLERSPERLVEVSGLGAVRREMIIKSWNSTAGLKRLLSFVSSFGLGPSLAVKIFKLYGTKAEEAIRENPYRLSYDIFGVGFQTADRVARTLGFSPDSPYRLEAGLLYCLDNAVSRGHDFLPAKKLKQDATNLIVEACSRDLSEAMARAALAGRIMVEAQDEPGDEAVYLPQTYRAETWVAKNLAAIANSPFAVKVPRTDNAILWVEKTLGFELSPEQREALRMAITEKICLITGGPGTGKTTMTKAVCQIWKAVAKKMALAAPTGRAAKRLSQATGFPATTIHRLLEYSKQGFVHGPDNPLDLDMLLLDEASMIDILLLNQLLAALPSQAVLVLVGDKDQLPSVGPGKVLGDLLDCGPIPSKRLTSIFRQADESLIVAAAHRINRGVVPTDLPSGPDVDFHFVAEENTEKLIDKIVRLVVERIPKKLGLNPLYDVMVLTPTRKGELGAHNLNAILGRALNPQPSPYISRFGQTFKVGDRVMQIKNNYARDVYNGDLGIVVHLDLEAQELRVNFEDRRSVYDFADLDELSVAWASTVHKAQGSEFEAVVIPIHPSHSIMLRRKLIYTAVTRGKRMVFVIGSKDCFRRAVQNNVEDERYSNLGHRLMRAFGGRPDPAPLYNSKDSNSNSNSEEEGDYFFSNVSRFGFDGVGEAEDY
jgi:exodeoxyribonuclease V alpha subunit